MEHSVTQLLGDLRNISVGYRTNAEEAPPRWNASYIVGTGSVLGVFVGAHCREFAEVLIPIHFNQRGFRGINFLAVLVELMVGSHRTDTDASVNGWHCLGIAELVFSSRLPLFPRRPTVL